MPTFSIIVPVYNAEKTLHKCLESLQSQSFSDFDVHMVENGSTDSSQSICREFANSDPRFVLHVSESNCGPSGARNIGLDHAGGCYIAFLDSDDYVEPEYLETLCDSLEEHDVAFLGYHQRGMDGKLIADRIPDIPDSTDYYEILLHLYKQDMFGYTWIKVFRRDIVGDHRFSRELNLLEDEVFACEVLAQPCRVAIIPKAIHNYITGNAGSLIGRTHQDYCRKVDIAYNAWKKLLENYDNKDIVLEQMANAHVNRCMYYGFERDVDVKMYFTDFAECGFFIESTSRDEFYVFVETQKHVKLLWMRRLYRVRLFVNQIINRLRKGLINESNVRK